MNKFEVIKNEGNTLEIKFYGSIGDNYWKDENDDSICTLEELNKVLKENKNVATIDIYINSNGGSVFDGIAIYNMLKRTRAYKRVFIEGFACSIASVIAMAGNSITMPKSSLMMIHNAWTIAMGNSKEFRKIADDLEKINESIRNAYMTKFNGGEELLKQLMDEESYLSADDCLTYGLATKISDQIDEESVEQALDGIASLYSNKLKTLNEIKNAIKSIDEVEDEVEEVEIPETEVSEVVDEVNEDPIEEAKEVEEVNETEAIESVDEIEQSAIKRFFNSKK